MIIFSWTGLKAIHISHILPVVDELADMVSNDILREIVGLKDVKNLTCFSIIVDETMDISHNEQLCV